MPENKGPQQEDISVIHKIRPKLYYLSSFCNDDNLLHSEYVPDALHI